MEEMMTKTILYDIGAHKGVFTRNMLKENPETVSYMFEANRGLSKPTDLKDHHWFNCVLSSRDKSVVNFFYRGGTGDSYYKETDMTGVYTNPQSYELQIRDTQHLTDFDIPLPDIIKIDTQGSELDILSDCDEILTNCKVIYTEVPAPGKIYNQGAPSYEEYMDFFRSHGFVNSTIEKEHVKRNKVYQYDMRLTK